MVRWQTWQAQRFEIFESARQLRIESNRIESGRPIRIRIESGTFAGPYQKATYAACEPVFLAVTEI